MISGQARIFCWARARCTIVVEVSSLSSFVHWATNNQKILVNQHKTVVAVELHQANFELWNIGQLSRWHGGKARWVTLAFNGFGPKKSSEHLSESFWDGSGTWKAVVRCFESWMNLVTTRQITWWDYMRGPQLFNAFRAKNAACNLLLDTFMESTLTSSSVEEGLPDIEIGVNVGKNRKIFLQSAWKMHSHLQPHP